MVTMDDDGDNEEGEPEDGVANDSPPEMIPPEISLNSVVGLSNPKTMKLMGSIQGEGVVIMVDPGATHNFVSLATVRKLGIP